MHSYMFYVGMYKSYNFIVIGRCKNILYRYTYLFNMFRQNFIGRYMYFLMYDYFYRLVIYALMFESVFLYRLVPHCTPSITIKEQPMSHLLTLSSVSFFLALSLSSICFRLSHSQDFQVFHFHPTFSLSLSPSLWFLYSFKFSLILSIKLYCVSPSHSLCANNIYQERERENRYHRIIFRYRSERDTEKG